MSKISAFGSAISRKTYSATRQNRSAQNPQARIKDLNAPLKSTQVFPSHSFHRDGKETQWDDRVWAGRSKRKATGDPARRVFYNWGTSDRETYMMLYGKGIQNCGGAKQFLKQCGFIWKFRARSYFGGRTFFRTARGYEGFIARREMPKVLAYLNKLGCEVQPVSKLPKRKVIPFTV